MAHFYAGGYIFSSALSDRQDVIELVMHVMEVTSQDELVIWLPDDEQSHNVSNLPREQAFQKLAQVEDGGFSFRKALDRPESYWFDQPSGPYQTVQVSCIDNLLNGDINPGGPDQIAKYWLSLCEEGKADFGFFGQFEEMLDIEYRDAQLHPLEQKDVRKLMELWSDYWLIYLGPELAERWRTLQQPLEVSEARWLPSGAFFVRVHPNLHF